MLRPKKPIRCAPGVSFKQTWRDESSYEEALEDYKFKLQAYYNALYMKEVLRKGEA